MRFGFEPVGKFTKFMAKKAKFNPTVELHYTILHCMVWYGQVQGTVHTRPTSATSLSSSDSHRRSPPAGEVAFGDCPRID